MKPRALDLFCGAGGATRGVVMYIIPLISLVLVGCGNGSTFDVNHQRELNEHIIRETKHCLEAGLEAHPLHDLNNVISTIQCWPKEQEKR